MDILKNYNTQDTIAAIATFAAKSALGIIKVSGPKAIRTVDSIFKAKSKALLKKAKTYTLHYGWIVDKKKPRKRGDKQENKVIDEVLVSIMRKPASYTREDVVEISSHGGTLVLNKIIELILKGGCRLAQPGEFTYRALISGRIDLLKAESILAIVDASSDNALSSALAQLRGEASTGLKQVKDKVRKLLIQAEAYINFPEEQISLSVKQLEAELKELKVDLNEILDASTKGKILKEGVRCVICGKANVGKSTLFNLLLRQERSIVTHIAGTTRDVVEEVIDIGGVPLRIYDTAGLLSAKDIVAQKALEKSYSTFKKADLVIFVADYSRRLDKDDKQLLNKLKAKQSVIVINKVDLKKKIEFEYLQKLKMPVVKISALRNKGIEELEKVIHKSVYKDKNLRESVIFITQFQRELIQSSLQTLEDMLRMVDSGQPFDHISFTLRQLLDDLGKVTGEVTSEEILESIFSQFCIGK